MNETKSRNGLEKTANATRKSGVLSAVLAIAIGIAMIGAAILMSNTFTGNTHVNEPTNIITVDSTYPSGVDMYVGENFSFTINWTPIHDVKDVVLWVEIVKPDVSLNDTSVDFAWVSLDGMFEDAVMTDIGDRFTLQTAPMNANAGDVVSFLVQMAYYVSGDWQVHFWADGSIA